VKTGRAFKVDEQDIGGLFMRSGRWLEHVPKIMDSWNWQCMAVGYVVKSWGECVDRHDPYWCTAKRNFADDMLFQGAFDGMVRERYIIDGEKPRWTGPRRDPNWLRVVDEFKTYVIAKGRAAEGHVKIGRSKNVPKRLGQLQSASSEPLRVIHELDFDCEASLHGRLKKHRIRGEWFSGSEEFHYDLAKVLSDFGVR
jgi:hypothetical protein